VYPVLRWAYNALRIKIKQLPDAYFRRHLQLRENAMQKSSLLLFRAALILMVPFAAVAALGQSAASKVKVTPDSQTKAKKLYAIDCALCHGENGDGKTDIAKDMQLTLTDWTDPAALSSQQDADLFKTIREGKGKMPAEEAGRAKDDDVWNLIVYIRNLSKGHPPAAAPAAPAASPTAGGR
jgi:mono/diheme cytochrome c family protein